MSTHVPGFQSFFSVFLPYFVLTKLAISSTIRVKRKYWCKELVFNPCEFSSHSMCAFLSNQSGSFV